MFIAMNRFRILKGREAAFEDIWRRRESRLDQVAGFRSFHLLRGAFDEATGATLYASHSIWESRADFEAWTRSQNFRDAHKNAGGAADMYAGHPQFEGFDAVLDA